MRIVPQYISAMTSRGVASSDGVANRLRQHTTAYRSGSHTCQGHGCGSTQQKLTGHSTSILMNTRHSTCVWLLRSTSTNQDPTSSLNYTIIGTRTRSTMRDHLQAMRPHIRPVCAEQHRNTATQLKETSQKCATCRGAQILGTSSARSAKRK